MSFSKYAVMGLILFSIIGIFPLFNKVFAERAAWGGNGGWWGGGNREWEGDFAGPAFRRTCNNFYSKIYVYPYSYYRYSYCSYPCYWNCQRAFYNDESVPGAAIYLDLRRR
jgi:hypothetical protein